MISSSVLHRHPWADGEHLCVWQTTFKGKVFHVACGIGTPSMSPDEIPRATHAARDALARSADAAGMPLRHEVYVRTPFAAGISIHTMLSEAYHQEAVFFLCASAAVLEQVLLALCASED